MIFSSFFVWPLLSFPLHARYETDFETDAQKAQQGVIQLGGRGAPRSLHFYRLVITTKGGEGYTEQQFMSEVRVIKWAFENK